MKKTYMIPAMKVVNIKVQNILAGSYTENTGSANEMSSGSFGARSSRFSSWEEEEDFE